MDVGAGGKGAVAGPGQNDRLDRLVRLIFAERILDLAHQRKAQRIELFRAVQRDDRAPIEALSQNELVFHRFLSFPHASAGSNIVAEPGGLFTPRAVDHSGDARWAEASTACGFWNWRGIRPVRAAA